MLPSFGMRYRAGVPSSNFSDMSYLTETMTEPTEPTPTAPERTSWWPKVIIGLIAIILVAGGLWWWFSRPIQPVVLSPKEMAAIEAKLTALQNPGMGAPAPSSPTENTSEPVYIPGKKEIIFSEREVNGLLNANTDLGKSLRFQLGTEAVIAHFETDLDPDLPILGGRRFKARARFLVSESSGRPSFVIDDLTIWGISLPNEWLGNIKGRNLLEEALGAKGENRLPGVKSFTIEPGKITIQLKE